jgi:hypothetical protein
LEFRRIRQGLAKAAFGGDVLKRKVLFVEELMQNK